MRVFRAGRGLGPPMGLSQLLRGCSMDAGSSWQDAQPKEAEKQVACVIGGSGPWAHLQHAVTHHGMGRKQADGSAECRLKLSVKVNAAARAINQLLLRLLIWALMGHSCLAHSLAQHPMQMGPPEEGGGRGRGQRVAHVGMQVWSPGRQHACSVTPLC